VGKLIFSHTKHKAMTKKYVVKDFVTRKYYCGQFYGWGKKAAIANYFDSVEDAEKFLLYHTGKFQIELVYVN
jgi:hypothetical protein